MDNEAAGYVSSCRKGVRPPNPDHKGNKQVQIIVSDAPVIMDATAPSVVALFQRNAARSAGVIEVPYMLYAVNAAFKTVLN